MPKHEDVTHNYDTNEPNRQSVHTKPFCLRSLKNSCLSISKWSYWYYSRFVLLSYILFFILVIDQRWI